MTDTQTAVHISQPLNTILAELAQTDTSKILRNLTEEQIVSAIKVVRAFRSFAKKHGCEFLSSYAEAETGFVSVNYGANRVRVKFAKDGTVTKFAHKSTQRRLAQVELSMASLPGKKGREHPKFRREPAVKYGNRVTYTVFL